MIWPGSSAVFPYIGFLAGRCAERFRSHTPSASSALSRPSAKPRRRCRKAFSPSRSKSASTRIAMSKWSAGCGTRLVLTLRSASTQIAATAQSLRRCARSDAWSKAISSISSSPWKASSDWQKSRAIDAPVMADESAWNAHDVIQIAEKRAAQIVSIYSTKPGGLYRAMEVAAVARAAGLICNVNGSVETGVGNLANIHLAASAPAAVLSCVVPVSTPAEAQTGQVAGIYYNDDLIAAPMRLVDGAIELPTGPGMGITVDEAKVRRYAVAHHKTG